MSEVGKCTSIVARAPKPRTRIVLVEDHAILREGVKALLEIEPDFEIAGDFGGVEECLLGLGQLQPDLVLTDLALPNARVLNCWRESNTSCLTHASSC